MVEPLPHPDVPSPRRLPMSFYPASPVALVMVVLATAAGPGVRAANLPTGMATEGYALRIWQTEDGLPQNTVMAITQTRDGYIWIGTYGGLARFDGVRFQNFDSINTPNLADARIVALHEDREGGLWIGHDSGQVTICRSGLFQPWDRALTHSAERVMAINSDAAGKVWLLRPNGTLESVEDGLIVPSQSRTAQPELIALIRDAGGDLYVGTDGEVARVSHGKLKPIDFGPARNSGFVMGLGPAQKDGMWVIRDWRVQKWNGPHRIEDRGPCPWGGDTSLSVLLEMQNGCLAVGTMDRGLYLFFPNKKSVHFDRSNGLPQNWVRSLCEDREGNLWVGAGSAGLAQLVPVPFAVINAPDQWQGRAELSVMAARDGALWIGTEGAGLYRFQDGAWAHYGPEQGLEHPFVWSVAQDPTGQIWAGTWSGGIFRLQGNRFVRAPEYDPLAGPVFALRFTPKDGGLWVGSGSGLLRWPEATSPGQRCELKNGSPNVCTIVRDRAGVVWFGSSGDGLGRLERGQIRRFGKRDGLSSDSVHCLLADDDGALWIGTSDSGLNRLKDGRFSTINVNHGLASNTICHIADDGRGHLWLSTHHGILRLAKAELNACADGRVAAVSGQVFDRNDGLPTIEFSGGLQDAGCKSADGRLWFTSSKGVVSVDPATIQLNPLPPPVVLESLRIDGRLIEIRGDARPDLRLPPDHQRIEFQYTALSLTAPSKVMFKHRLAGIDHDWIEAGTKRTATYSRLSAGKYVFQVIARNNDGVWNTQGVSLSLTVLPFFWATWWFLGLTGLLGLTALIWSVRHVTRRRMQRRVEELERVHAIERERARIAQDIHDDVGASLTRITMLTQCVTRDPSQPPQTAEVLDHIYGTAREVTRALDEIVWAVDPRHDSLDSLVSYMGKYAQDLLATAGIRCRLDLAVKLPEWPLTAEIRHNLFLAFKEALNNTLKHAAATEVRLTLALRPDAFVLTIADNGRGFEPSALPPPAPDRVASGNGLANLQRRLAGIGGHCEVVSSAGAGTRVSFIVDVPDASRRFPPPFARRDTLPLPNPPTA